MEILIKTLIALVAVLHIYFLYLEMFAWTTRGPKAFKNIPADQFASTKTMAGNQGLYNGFLAAGLFWSLLIKNPDWQQNVGLFFLACVAIAGIYGAATVSKRIFFIQAAPALLAIALLLADGAGSVS
jgi:putative membrane protein